jgi:plasmid stabilization system protein ParE
MSYTVVQRQSARRDILAIIDRISDENPAAAAALYEAYEYSLELLKTTPEMGRVYRSADPRLAHIRALSIPRYRNYLIFYATLGSGLKCCISGTAPEISPPCSRTSANTPHPQSASRPRTFSQFCRF